MVCAGRSFDAALRIIDDGEEGGKLNDDARAAEEAEGDRLAPPVGQSAHRSVLQKVPSGTQPRR